MIHHSFGLYEALSDTSMLSNVLLISWSLNLGILSVLLPLPCLLLVKKLNYHRHIDWACWSWKLFCSFEDATLGHRCLITRLTSVIPVLICCVSLSAGQSAEQEHEALNNLMINSQAFLSLVFTIFNVTIIDDDK